MQACVQPGTGLLTLREVEVPIDVIHLRDGNARRNIGLCVAEHPPRITTKDTDPLRIRSLEQLQIVVLLRAADVLHHYREAVQRRVVQHSIRQDRLHDRLRLAAELGVAGRAVLQALALPWLGLEARQARNVAAPLAVAVLVPVGALVARGKGDRLLLALAGAHARGRPAQRKVRRPPACAGHQQEPRGGAARRSPGRAPGASVLDQELLRPARLATDLCQLHGRGHRWQGWKTSRIRLAAGGP
mmetsp:Transcript_40803/g.114270  ORF Transcript_40803/g.114270 Transcript_40803/m.114270 type:complete len:244 (-) Transcript_40803:21-752(-)